MRKGVRSGPRVREKEKLNRVQECMRYTLGTVKGKRVKRSRSETIVGKRRKGIKESSDTPGEATSSLAEIGGGGIRRCWPLGSSWVPKKTETNKTTNGKNELQFLSTRARGALYALGETIRGKGGGSYRTISTTKPWE